MNFSGKAKGFLQVFFACLFLPFFLSHSVWGEIKEKIHGRMPPLIKLETGKKKLSASLGGEKNVRAKKRDRKINGRKGNNYCPLGKARRRTRKSPSKG